MRAIIRNCKSILEELQTNRFQKWIASSKNLVAAHLRSLWSDNSTGKNILIPSWKPINYMLKTADFIFYDLCTSLVIDRKHADHHTELIQTRTELLRNKQTFPDYLKLKGAIFISFYSPLIQIHFQILHEWCAVLLIIQRNRRNDCVRKLERHITETFLKQK